MSKIIEIYVYLMDRYGPQGWWPLLGVNGVNPTKSGSINGYHPTDYSYPRTNIERFEIICGALLTQNTAWPNVEKALRNLKELDVFSPNKLILLDMDKLKEAIKPAGYFNQKADRLKQIAKWFMELEEGYIPLRNELLALKGVGPETADSILLYAFGKPEFVVDAYTKRVFSNLGIIKEDMKYDDVKRLFESELEKNYPDEYERVVVYQEYHALIVEHAKRYYLKKALYETDWLIEKL